MGNKFQVIWRLLVVVFLALLPVSPVLASPVFGVTIKMQFSAGVEHFTITQITNTDIHFTWTYDPSLYMNFMIRGDYGRMPSDITSPTDTPNDGYLVYYGSGTSADDTSINTDDNPGFYYYKAWAQNLDGTWQMITLTGSQESTGMLLIAFIGLFIGLLVVNIMARNSFTPQKLIAALAWVIPLVWAANYPPSFMVAGSTIQTATVVVLWGMLIICIVAAFRRQLNVSVTKTNRKSGEYTNEGYEGNGWHLPSFMQNGVSEEQLQIESKRARMERKEEYRNRFRNALNPKDRED